MKNGITWGEAIMKKIGYLLLFTTFCLFTMAAAADEKAAKQSNIGVGFNVGFQKPYCDVLHTGAGLAGEFMARFFLGKYVDLSFGLGYGTLNDGFSYNTFQTDLVTGDVKANVHLSKPGRINPYLSLGAGVVNFGYTRNKPWAIGTSDLEGERFFDGSFIYGGGMEIMTSPQTAINLLADYRFSTGDALDGAEVGKSKDGYLNTRIGFTYYLGKRPTKSQPSQDELLALQHAEYGAGGGGEQGGSENKLSRFEAKLDNLEASDTELSMEQYVRLKSRVDELTGMVEGKDKELDELRSTLDNKNQRIVDLENAVKRTTAAPAGQGNFADTYEEALRQFYSRDYSTAITLFKDLLNRYPSNKLASNCYYWIGESYFGLKEYESAASAFQSVFNYDNSPKKDDATIMLGRAYYNLNEHDKAKSYFQALLDDYPDSEYVSKARQWLGRL